MFGVDVHEATDSLGAPKVMVFSPRKALVIKRIPERHHSLKETVQQKILD